MAVAARTASELDVEHKREMSEAEKLREVGLRVLCRSKSSPRRQFARRAAGPGAKQRSQSVEKLLQQF